jgi:hypothetical protein
MKKETAKKMNLLKRLGLGLVAAMALPAVAAPAALAAEAKPALTVSSLATPTAFTAGDSTSKAFNYDIRVVNIGAAKTNGSAITITDTLPKGLTVQGEGSADHGLQDCGNFPSSPGGSCEFKLHYTGSGSSPLDFGKKLFGVLPSFCKTERSEETTTLICTIPSTVPPPLPPTADEPSNLYPDEEMRLRVFVEAPAELGGESFAGKPLANNVEVSGGGSAVAEVTSHNETAKIDEEGNPVQAPSGFSFYHALVIGPDGQPATAAGSHPYQWVTSFAINTAIFVNPAEPTNPVVAPASGDVKDTRVTLPPGLTGNPTAIPRCSNKDFQTTSGIVPPEGGFYGVNACPPDTAVGMVIVQEVEGLSGSLPVPLYNVEPSPGEPLKLGFQIANIPFFIDTEARPEDNYQVKSGLLNQSQLKRVSGATVIVWGNPAEAGHDGVRGPCLNPLVPQYRLAYGEPGPCEGVPGAGPFLRTPTSCGAEDDLPFAFSTWPEPAVFRSESSPFPAMTECAKVPFEPQLEARPTTNVADSPTGLHTDLHVPQPDGCGEGAPEEPAECELGEADLRKTVVTLPQGLALNPSSANGLGACSIAEIGYLGGNGDGPGELFSNDPAACPEDSKIGTVEVDTPLIDHPLKGAVYVAAPHANPFDSLLAIYIAVNDPKSGIVIKLPGHVEPDPNTGQLKTTFDNTPQQPFEDFKLEFFGGAKAALRTPAVCGNYSTDSTMTPWSAPEGSSVSWSDHYSITGSPTGGACATSAGALPNAPFFEAGTEAPIAGDFSPLVMNLRRDDGSQEFSQLTLDAPPGIAARLAGVPYCPDGDLAAAEGKSGHDEEAGPSCPAASQVGTVRVGAGAGPSPYYTGGKVYLAGPYKGAPLSLAIITPATAGPYDLGTVVVRTALYIDPVTAQVKAVSDPIPHILQGIPLDVRSVSVKIDHEGWALNPSNCEATSFGGSLLSTAGQTAALANRFQVGECGRLKFGPHMRLRLKGGTKRTANPKLIADVYSQGVGVANLSRVQVKLPRSAFLDQAHIRTVCTRVQFAAGGGNGESCPKGSIYGRVWVKSPLFDYWLAGDVYLRSSNHKLPDLVLGLNGPPSQPIHVELAGKTDSVKGALRNTFEAVPDAPFTRARVVLFGGKRGLVVNSRDICARKYRANVRLVAQSGKVEQLHPLVRNSCGKAQGKRHKRHHKKR